MRRWGRGELGGRDCLEEECRIARATRDELVAFLEPFELDPAFAAVVERAEALGWELQILSDGLDFYIAHLLARARLERIPFRTNRLTLGPGGALVPAFPHFAAGCGRCGTCKGAEVAARRRAGRIVWFAGDGISDRCAAPLADRLFARRDLLAFARDRSIPHTPFDSLADLLDALPPAPPGRAVAP